MYVYVYLLIVVSDHEYTIIAFAFVLPICTFSPFWLMQRPHLHGWHVSLSYASSWWSSARLFWCHHVGVQPWGLFGFRPNEGLPAFQFLMVKDPVTQKLLENNISFLLVPSFAIWLVISLFNFWLYTHSIEILFFITLIPDILFSQN